MAEFLDERFPADIDYGSGFETEFAAEVSRTVGGGEYRKLSHPYLMSSLDVDFTRLQRDVIARIVDLNMRAGGIFRAFRVKSYLDFSTNNYRDTPTALDQPMSLVSAGVYQLMRWYGNPADTKCSRRRLRKPVAGSVLVGVAGAVYPSAQWSVDNATGLVTLAANKTRSITAITKAASAVLTVGSHSFVVGNSVVISGVAGMTQINGLRALVTAISGTTITVAINSTAFSTYTSGGTVQTQPVTGEAVTCGAYFDIPMRFTEDLGGTFTSYGVLSVSGVGLAEVLNP